MTQNDDEDVIPPFPDEFSNQNVANRPKELDYEEFVRVEDGDLGEPLLTTKDIKEMLAGNPRAAIDRTIEYKRYANDSEGSTNIIKAKDAAQILEYSSEELVKPDIDTTPKNPRQPSNAPATITREVIHKKVEIDEVVEKELDYFEKTDPIGRDLARMKKDFSDYIISPRIAGDIKPKEYRNLFTSDYLKEENTTVELIDSPNYSEFHRENSMIEINRDADGEILSIVVYCKCGEKTVIKLDYFDPDTEKDMLDNSIDDDKIELTSIINDETEVQDL